jgi:hypothetical protein
MFIVLTIIVVRKSYNVNYYHKADIKSNQLSVPSLPLYMFHVILPKVFYSYFFFLTFKIYITSDPSHNFYYKSKVPSSHLVS